MYIPAHFAADPAEVGDLLAKHGAADLIKPNALELQILTGMPTDTDEEVERVTGVDILASDREIFAEIKFGAQLLDRGMAFPQRFHS